MNYVITQEDFDVNPLITQLGLKAGDTISYTKPEAEVEPEVETPAPEAEAPAEETPADAPVEPEA